MTQRQAFIACGVCVLLAEVILTATLKLLGADDETQASAYALFLGFAGLSSGLFMNRYL
jgi:hypothetical protein